ncbi:MAG: calcium-binding protein, partial [Cyanobacteria bacterium P01_F01_bin.42]
GDQGDDTLRGGGGSDSILGGSGDDVAAGGSGNDLIEGGEGDDRLNGNAGDDTVSGDTGSDTLKGGSGNDLILGEFGSDILVGGSGDDVLIGGVNQDTMTGGAGSDTFLYRNDRHGVDLITDFEAGVDLFDLTALVESDSFTSDTPFEDYIQLNQTGSDTVVRFDSGGDRIPNQFVTLARLENVVATDLSASDFVFS